MNVVAPAVAVPKLQLSEPAVAALPEISARAWLTICVCIMLVTAVLRFYALELKPLHHDEGVNGFFMTSLVHRGVYKYDPSNYHGPTLYYLTLPATVLFGLDTIALRVVTALFGLGTVWLIFGLRRQLGTLATLVASALIAVSPGAVYYSRYYIHETLFVFFSLGIVVAAIRFYETARLKYLAAAVISTALLFATKETAFVSPITFGLAWIFVALWIRKVVNPQRSYRHKKQAKANDGGPDFIKLFGDQKRLPLILAAVGILFVAVNTLFYSSFFSNWQGVRDAISALAVWSNTGTSEFHGKPFDTYLRWLLAEEAPIFLLAIAGSLVALFERSLNRFAIFAGAWGFGMLAAYSFIPYKTPWLALNFIIPMAIIAGYAVPSLANRLSVARKPWASVALVSGLAILLCAYQALVINFRQYDNDAYPYVYAHTSRELQSLVSEVERLSARAGRKDVGISVAAPEHWPLPWYFRNNPRVGFFGTMVNNYDPNDVQLIIARESAEPQQDQVKKLKELLGDKYRHVGSYALRPGVRLALFAESKLATD